MFPIIRYATMYIYNVMYYNLQFCNILQYHILEIHCKGILSTNMYYSEITCLSITIIVKDTDKIIKAQQSSNNFFIWLHDDMNAWSNAFVH